jgi:hypothetical protein
MPFDVVATVAAVSGAINAANTVAGWLCCCTPSGGSGGSKSGSGSGPKGGNTTNNTTNNTEAPMSGLTASFAPVSTTASPSLVGQPKFCDAQIALPATVMSPVQAPAPVNAKRGGPIGHYGVGGGIPDVSLEPTFAQGSPELNSGFTKNIRHPNIGHVAFGHKAGGEIHEHRPEFFSEGGLKHTFVEGAGDGTSDSVPAMLANGEFVIPADVVSSLGNGDNKSGAKVMDEFLKTVRSHKRNAAPGKLPPDSKGPLGYLQEAKKKVK